MNIQEKIDLYLQGAISDSEKERIKKELLDLGPEVAEELEEMKMIKHIIRQDVVHEKLAFLKSLEHKEQTNKSQNKPKNDYTYIFIVLLVAAAISYYLYNLNSATYKFDDYYDNYAYTESFRSIDEDVTNISKEGFQAYSSGNYQLCVSLLEEQKNQEALFYKGLAYMELSDYPNAIKAFESMEQSNYPVYYYLSLSYLENNNVSLAKQTLKKIPEKQTLYYQKAKELLQKI